MAEKRKATLVAKATELGFVRLGVARVEPLTEEAKRLRAWLEDGRHADMDWMARTAEVRCDPSHPGMLPDAQSVVILAATYHRRDLEPVGPSPSRVARYARGRDYHNVLRRAGRKLAKVLTVDGDRCRVCVDSAPVFERAWAARAGVGFVGKNCCLIVPGIGSYVFLLALVTTAVLPPDEPIRAGCGRCTACLDACPTAALVAAGELDARKCVAYHTIENRGSIPEPLREGMGAWLFGCDVCQEVCPYNATSNIAEGLAEPYAPHPRHASIDAPALLKMDEPAFEVWASASPLRRSGRKGLARNAAIVLGNTGDKRYLPVLQSAAVSHDEPVVREAAAWAVSRIEAGWGNS
ncbi:MAG: tRNA epoxyqueuosine(34) reductase QueG [Myxococcota bacterium]